MLMANDKVGASIIFGDDALQQRITRPGHSHGYRQKAHHRRFRWEVPNNMAVAAYTGVIIEISWACHAHPGKQKQVGAAFMHGTDAHLEVRPVNGVKGMITDNAIPA